MHVFIIGYPGDIGGANTECLHTVLMLRRHGVDVTLVPTWRACPRQRERLDAAGCVTTEVENASELYSPGKVPGLAGSVTLGLCNQHYVAVMGRLQDIGCRTLHMNCMTFLFAHEIDAFRARPPSLMLYHTEFQRRMIETQALERRVRPMPCAMVRGAFDPSEFPFEPRERVSGDPFVIGKIARAARDKWPRDLWETFEQVKCRGRRAHVMGIDAEVGRKIGPAPAWATVLNKGAVTARQFYSKLHCLLPINCNARENWPRAGLEAMSAGVPVVAEDQWGWREMILPGMNGLLGSTRRELAELATALGEDEGARMRLVRSAREMLIDDLANDDKVWATWEKALNLVTA